MSRATVVGEGIKMDGLPVFINFLYPESTTIEIQCRSEKSEWDEFNAHIQTIKPLSNVKSAPPMSLNHALLLDVIL